VSEAARTIVTKLEYAALKQRSPQAVSNWIAEGKLTAAALVGQGQRARIWVEQADRDLARFLDPSQQAAQPRPIDQAAAAPPPGGDLFGAPGTTSPAAASGDDIARKRRADADSAELAAERARRLAEVESGRWVEAAEAKKQWGAELTKVITELETFIGTALPKAIADHIEGADWKTISVIARQEYRKYRAGVADRYQKQLAARTPAPAPPEPAPPAAEPSPPPTPPDGQLMEAGA
jgi:hypothetical protein